MDSRCKEFCAKPADEQSNRQHESLLTNLIPGTPRNIHQSPIETPQSESGSLFPLAL
jgi:hypothetical protein